MGVLIRFINSSHFLTLALFVVLSFFVVSNSKHKQPAPVDESSAVTASAEMVDGEFNGDDESGQDQARTVTRLFADHDSYGNPHTYEYKEIIGKIKKGDSLVASLKRNSVPDEARDQIVKSLRSHLDLRNILPSHQYSVTVDEEGELVRCHYDAGPFETYTVARTSDGYVTSREDVKLECRTVKLSGEIESSLFNAFASKDESPKLVYAFADIFSSKIDFNTEIKRGDRFSLIVEKYYKDDELVGYGKILAVRYEKNNKEAIEGYYYDGKNGGTYFDIDGNEFGMSFIRSPVTYARVTSGFTNRRKHPITGVVRPHLGVDLAAPTGTPVMAAADGVVKSIGWNGGFGKLITIEHGGDMETYYGHLSRYAKGLKKGDRVRQKEIIGYVGTTGLSTGPHLHYQISVNGVFKNPFSVQFRPKSVLGGRELRQFNEFAHSLRQHFVPPEDLLVVEVKNVSLSATDNIRFL